LKISSKNVIDGARLQGCRPPAYVPSLSLFERKRVLASQWTRKLPSRETEVHIHAQRGAAALIAAAGLLLTGTASHRRLRIPTQQIGATTQQGPTPLFRITVVGHTTPAINYRPRKGDTKVDFTGTALSPLATGNATVEGKKGYIDIDAKFDKLAPPTQFGPEYLTYVLWAVTPEGTFNEPRRSAGQGWTRHVSTSPPNCRRSA
jgi:hypothetical protein